MNYQKYTTEQLEIFHRLARDKRRGLKPFFNVKQMIRLRKEIEIRRAWRYTGFKGRMIG